MLKQQHIQHDINIVLAVSNWVGDDGTFYALLKHVEVEF